MDTKRLRLIDDKALLWFARHYRYSFLHAKKTWEKADKAYSELIEELERRDLMDEYRDAIRENE